MKRSEVVSSIVDNCLAFNGIDTDQVLLKDLADDILTHLENLGMLPPEGEFIFKRDLGEGLDVSFIKKERRWEQEGD